MLAVESEELQAMLFSLGFATARICQRQPLKKAADYIASLFIEGKLQELGGLCISPYLQHRDDFVFKYELLGVNKPRLENKQGQVPSDRVWTYYTPRYESKYGSGYGWYMRASRIGNCWRTEQFVPKENLYIVYQPGLRLEDANDCACRFSENKANLTANVIDGKLYPLAFPLDINSFGNDAPLLGFNGYTLADLLFQHKSLTAAWYEWQLVEELPYPESDFIETGKLADRIVDVCRPGEWCLLDPNRRVHCNPARMSAVFPIQDNKETGLNTDAPTSLLTLKSEAFAESTFLWLLGKERALNMEEVADGLFLATVPNLQVYLSLADNEKNLFAHALALTPKPQVKAVVITPFLEEGEYAGITDMLSICPKYAYSKIIGPCLYDRYCEWEKLMRENHLTGQDDPKFTEFAKRNLALVQRLLPDAERWYKLLKTAIMPSLIVTEQGIPKAPEGYDWEDLTIEVGILEGNFFLRTWFTHHGTGRIVARSRKIKAALIEGFGSRKTLNGVSALFEELVYIVRSAHTRVRSCATAQEFPHRTRKGPEKRHQSKKALSDVQRTRRHELKSLLQRLLGLPDIKNLVSKDGIPCFKPLYSPGSIGTARPRKAEAYEESYDDWILDRAAATDISGQTYEGAPADAPRPRGG